MSCAPTPAPTPTSDAVELANLKRKYATLEAKHAVMEAQGGRSAEIAQINMGRGLRRIVDMFADPRDLVSENDRREELLANGKEVESTPEQDTTYRSYMELIKRVPLLKHLLEQGEEEAISQLYRNLRKGSDMARGDDTSKLKTATVGWVDTLFGVSSPPLRPGTKHERGLDNDHTGRLICPAEYAWDDTDKIREGDPDFQVTAHSWPNFMYADYQCDPEDVEKGFLKSHLMAFKHIYTSPSSANASDDASDEQPTKRAKNTIGTSTRSSVAKLINLDKVTPRSIAYVAVQLRFALSNASSWRLVDIDFDHIEFYGAVIEYFERAPGPRSQAKADKLLEWWNRQIFGRRTGASTESDRAHRPASSSVALLAAHRQALEEGEN
ncbi:hypothetical protein HWV62_11485 [Athelia sp. TMB]|nr:hypothetical protein HWV62_11485 [Athelia sp. TMB]